MVMSRLPIISGIIKLPFPLIIMEAKPLNISEIATTENPLMGLVETSYL